MIKRFPIGLTITTAISLAILIWLGVWQLERLAWKEDLLAKRAGMATMQARPLGEVIADIKDPQDLDMIRVTVDCPGLAQAPYESLYGMAQGQMVSRLISACRLKDAPYDAILVDRGYVLDTVSSRPAVIADDYPAHVVGLLIPPEQKGGLTSTVTVKALPTTPEGAPKLWFGRDLPGIAKALGVSNPAPLFLIAETSTNPDWKPLTPGLPPIVINNRHMEYAMTWFGLAGALACVYAAMLWRRLKG